MTQTAQEHTFETHGDTRISTTFSMPIGFPSLEGLSFKEKIHLGTAIGKFQRPSVSLETMHAKTIMVQGCIQHPATVVNMQTGEAETKIRTVFALQNGDCVSSTSQAVARFVQQLYTMFGTPTLGMWEECIPVLVLPQKTARGGHTTYALSIAED